MKLKANKAKSGFTLVEMIVAITIFTVVSVASVGSVIIILDANRRARSTEIVLNNLNFALEDMARSARTGTTYFCQGVSNTPSIPHIAMETPADCAFPGGQVFAFEEEKLANGNPGDQTVYSFEPHPIIGTAFQLTKGKENSGSMLTPVTPENVVIEEGRFIVRGSPSGDGLQPYVIVTMTGYVSGGVQVPFVLQTTIAQRVQDF